MRLAAPLVLGLLLGSVLPASAQIYTRRSANGTIEATNVPSSDGFRLTYPGKGVLIHSRGFRPVRYKGEYDQHILAASAAFNVPIDLVKAVIQVESEFDPRAVSSAGARGLMQLMPFTARRFGVTDSFDPRQNIFGGVQYLRFLLDLFAGDVTLALAGYNAGENAVQRYGGIPPYKETQGYVRKIQSILTFTPGAVPGGPSRAAYYVPSGTLGPVVRATPREAVRPARPQPFYRWRDEQGIVHLATAPPADGIFYSVIRALD
jgi:hypothetical protein